MEDVETADEYGSRENCLKNHRKWPFCFEACASYLQDTIQKTGKDGILVDQPEMRPLIPPRPTIMPDSFEARDDLVEYYLESPRDPSLKHPPSITDSITGLDIYRDLLIPVELLDLGSSHELDTQRLVKEISTKRFGNPFDQWLPLSSVVIERDEGLPFPSHANRLQSLLQREVDREQLVLSNEAMALERELHSSSWSSELQEYLDNVARADLSLHMYSEPITPPLSPISEDELPFVPSNGGNIIDLTSEPSSPIPEQAQILQKNLEIGCFDSEPAAPSVFPISSLSQRLPDMITNPLQGLHDLQMDLPVVLTSSDALCEENAIADACPPLTNHEHLLDPPNEKQLHFEEAFLALIEDRASYIKNLTKQEQLNPPDSIPRIEAPIPNFETSPSEWSTKLSTAKSQLCFLRDSVGARFYPPIAPRNTTAEIAPKWAPVPPRSGRVVDREELACSIESARDFLDGIMPTWNNTSFLSIKKDMVIPEQVQDEEIEDLAQLTDDEAELLLSSPRLTSQNETRTGQPNITQETRSNYFPRQDWSTLIDSTRKRPIDAGTSTLPRPSDTDATSNLVSNFMQLRGKKPRIDTPVPVRQRKVTGTAIPQARSSTAAKDQPFVCKTEVPKVPAIAPEVEPPAEKGTFFISLSLGGSIISYLEAMWPPESLIDVDHSLYNTTVWSPATSQQREVISTLSYEADVSLSPSVGIVVTNLLKVRQRTLPGSKTLSSLRERITKVSQKYETLIILVSESNPAGEFMEPLSLSDAAAYADFVRFTIALDAVIQVYLVPGAERTLAKWILSLMCQHSPRAVPIKPFLSANESSWELLLRRAGMNLIAAKVLSKLLFEDDGPVGLAQFLASPVQNRVSRFAALLGGEKILRKASEMLDRQ